MSPERYTAVKRLRTIIGHLEGVITMLEDGRPGEEVLHQLCAVQAALRATGYVLLQNQMEDSLAFIRENPCADERQAELEKLCDLYRFVGGIHSRFKEAIT